jgi:hypothetical protein
VKTRQASCFQQSVVHNKISDVGIVGALPGSLVTERPTTEQRHSSSHDDKRSSIVSQVLSTLHIRDQQNKTITAVISALSQAEKKQSMPRSKHMARPSLMEAKHVTTSLSTSMRATIVGIRMLNGQTKKRRKLCARYVFQHLRHSSFADILQLDWKICSWVCFMFFALQLDRGNIAQALTDNMLRK